MKRESAAGYAVNNPYKKIGMLLGAKAGDVIWYYKTDGDKKKKAGISMTLKKSEYANTKKCSWLQ